MVYLVTKPNAAVTELGFDFVLLLGGNSIMLPNLLAVLKEGLLTVVVLALVLGSLGIAILDPQFRPAFADLAKVGIAGYLGWMIPHSPSRR
ncbi:MAG TPA: hypothetical protein VE944_33480 [Nostoc sp.]|uniref:hypothetical protein n=1 Tax=Nostoc sp. TaxID=1180 RepID=UPI002D3A7DEA|nr:hypothetical protein [Nostoc sp.]HYX19177.1 hypothetical protein [Nostoc sp.]